MSENRKLGSRLIDQFLAGVERVGNTLPHPASLFGILAGFVILLSWIFSGYFSTFLPGPEHPCFWVENRN